MGESASDRRFVAVSADTARLMGVDFLPVARRAAVDGVRDTVFVGADSKGAHVEAKPLQRGSDAEGANRDISVRLLDELRARYEADAPHQHFVTDHHSIVFGEGDPCARLMFIGEAPGAEEDKTGRPFVGKAGQLLEKMILAMGLRREDVYICNVLKTRPPGNATPTGREAELCKPYLIDQIRIVNPQAIVTLGLPASKTVLATEASMGSLRGKFARVVFHAHQGILESVNGLRPEGMEIPVMPTYHPAYLLRDYTPENRKKVWDDLLQVVKLLGLTPRSVVTG
ncbi:MAG: uracil-DNA glycosylase [Phycisphaeraceae bacterium]|nr:uracil-DNA glycosylase [Phycisphaeraceae bacterium]